MAAKSDFKPQGILTNAKQNWLLITKTHIFVNWNTKDSTNLLHKDPCSFHFSSDIIGVIKPQKYIHHAL